MYPVSTYICYVIDSKLMMYKELLIQNIINVTNALITKTAE